MKSPYPRTYYKGRFNRKEDEKLANELFYGTSTINKKTGREQHDYLPVDSSDEHRAIEALDRLLSFSCGDLDEGILAGLLCSLNPGGIFWRRLVFKQRNRKRSAGRPTDLQIALYARSRGYRSGAQHAKKEKIVQQAVAHFGLKARYAGKAVYEALNRIRDKEPWLLEEYPWEDEDRGKT